MILKVRTLVNRDGRGKLEYGWQYYDYLKSTTVYNEVINGKVVSVVDMTESPHGFFLTIDTAAFLMNDNGKTIQVINGSWEEDRGSETADGK